jgi:flagellar motor protein MotB
MKLNYSALFMATLLHPAFAQADSEAAKNSTAAKAINSISELVKSKNLSHIEIIPEKALIRVKGQSFQDHSKCLNEKAENEISKNIGELIESALESDESITLQISGNSNIPSAQNTAPESDCTASGDEYSLSYMRASSVRKALSLSSDFDIDTVGNGADELLNEDAPSSPENNRVDIQFIAEPQY